MYKYNTDTVKELLNKAMSHLPAVSQVFFQFPVPGQPTPLRPQPGLETDNRCSHQDEGSGSSVPEAPRSAMVAAAWALVPGGRGAAWMGPSGNMEAVDGSPVSVEKALKQLEAHSTKKESTFAGRDRWGFSDCTA